jgi:hypothetical protein
MGLMGPSPFTKRAEFPLTARERAGLALQSKSGPLQPFGQIPLAGGDFVIVDAADLDWLRQWSWRADVRNAGYARRAESVAGARHTILMHRQILGAPDGVQVDHVNGYGLDNRRANLRLCTAGENACNVGLRRDNRAGFKGVRQDKEWWMARIQKGGRTVYLGCFRSAEEAARAYDVAALAHHGEFARLNFPDGAP